MKIVWIDIGTHFAQEYSSIFCSNFVFFFRIFKRLISFTILRRGWFNLNDIKLILHSRKKIKRKKDSFVFFFVEANPFIINKGKAYKYANSIFNTAITDGKKNFLEIVKLYVANNLILSQGNSIFFKKT